MLDQEKKQAVESRLGRIAGQVGGIQRMIDGDRYCVDVLNQIAAVKAALTRVGAILLDSHIRTCVAESFEAAGADDRDQKIRELVDVFSKNCGS